jgi:hypothetical protein
MTSMASMTEIAFTDSDLSGLLLAVGATPAEVRRLALRAVNER